MTTNNNATRNYRNLSKLENLDDWQVHHDDTDIRGWNVYANDGTVLGEVENLIADTEARRVRYVEIELEEKLIGLDHLNSDIRQRHEDGDRYIVVPIGLISVDENNDKVRIDQLNSTSVCNMPRYNQTRGLNANHEIQVYRYLVGPAGNPAADKLKRTYNEKDYVGAPAMESEFYESSYFSDTPMTDSIKGRLNSRRNNPMKSTTHQNLS